MIIPLDVAGRHRLRGTREKNGWRLVLEHSEGSRRAPLFEALRAHLTLAVGGASYRLQEPYGSATVPLGELVVRLQNDAPLAVVDLHDARVMATPLSPYESRFLAQNGVPHAFPEAAAIPWSPATDLHTHFAGAARAQDLIAIGLALDLALPAAIAAEAGIHTDGDAPVPLAALSPAARDAFADDLSIPIDRKVPFLDLERVYFLRSAITRDLRAFLPICRAIARDLAASGVRYAELSHGGIHEAARLRLAHEGLPAIEAETGVTLRFLAAFSRHNDPEWDADQMERVMQVIRSRYIVGIDVMGHETNSSRELLPRLADFARRAGAARPGFVVRVHAGENPAHPENVRVVLEACAGTGVAVRIGHGLYGVDAPTRARLAAEQVIVEFNLNSNFALNNIQSCLDAPLVPYLEAGVPVVLGTDGHGIYRTSGPLEVRVARLAGARPEHFARIAATEEAYLERRRAWDAAGTSALEIPDDAPPVHYSPAATAARRAAEEARTAALLARLESLEVPVMSADAISSAFEGRIWISIAGAWKNAWERLDADARARMDHELGRLIARLDPARVVLVTGGTSYGVEGRVHAHARPRGIPLVGVLVRATPADGIAAGGVTHACVVGRTLHEKAARLYELMQRTAGLCLFVGGGPIVSDEIQAAANLRVRFLLMDGVPGASAEHAKRQPARAFRTADEVLAELDRRHVRTEPFWYPGPNPSVDVVVVRRRAHGREVLLVRRDLDAPAEQGKWALPGGFRRSSGARGEPWREDVETAAQAALRELAEETGLDLCDLAAHLVRGADYEGGARDPRDTATAWSRSTLFAIALPDARASGIIAGGDDACDARWFPLDPPPRGLAFDHDRLLADGLALLA